jgi:membrane protein
MKKTTYKIWDLIKDAGKKYSKDDPIKLAGTTAYFTIFAIAPILIIIISVLGIFLGEESISSKLYAEINNLVGKESAEFIREIVDNYQSQEKGIIGTIIGIAIFLVASTTFFTVLQNSLNFVWRIKAKPKNNFLKAMKDRLLSFGLILSLGFIMLVSLLIDAAISFVKNYLTDLFPDITLVLIQAANILISFAITTLIFAIIYKFLPDAKIRWRVTWVGALITAALFFLGKFLIGLALGNTNIGALYGTAGSVVLFLLWVFYSSIILFFGAEVTLMYSLKFDRDIVPENYAVRFEIDEVKEQQ